MTDATGASANEQVDLTSMRVADLQALASQMGIRGAARLRKGELVRAIEEARDAAAPKVPATDTKTKAESATGQTRGRATQKSDATEAKAAGTERSGSATDSAATSTSATDSADATSSDEATSTGAGASSARKRGGTRRSSTATQASSSTSTEATSSDSATGDETQGKSAQGQSPQSSQGESATASSAQDDKATTDSATSESAPSESATTESGAGESGTGGRTSRGQRRSRSGSGAGTADKRASSNDDDPIAAAIFPDTKKESAPQGSDKRTDAEGKQLSLDDLVLPPARGEDDENDADDSSRGRRRRRVAVAEGSDSDRDDTQSDDDSDNDGERHGSRRRSRGRRGRNNDGDNSKSQQDDGDDDDQSSDDQQNGRRGRRGRDQQDDDGDDRRGRGRYRDRKRGRGDDVDPEISPDDVLLPIAGILDVLDNYAFVRTSGYLPGSNDVYVSLAQVKKYGLRKGDAIVGAVRQPRDGEQQHGRQKFNAIVKIDTINGQTTDEVATRTNFDELTPLYPEERLHLETDEGRATQRMIDLFAPIGKGTRGLIVAPPKAGKSVVLQQIANAIAENSPQTHLMLVLVDERPEEVTSMRRTIRGEVVASTFDLPAEDHTTIAELAIERAKRLVELGHDVVVLLDSITALCRAYNLGAPASGRILAGGVDASALYPPKRFFGAARNVENGGSLTVLATAMIETGSRTDEVILEEFAGKGNMELRLSREIADKRIFPALDIQHSMTMQEEQLLSQDEVDVTWAIRRELSHGDTQLALEAVLDRLSATRTNEEFLRSVRNQPIAASGSAR